MTNTIYNWTLKLYYLNDIITFELALAVLECVPYLRRLHCNDQLSKLCVWRGIQTGVQLKGSKDSCQPMKEILTDESNFAASGSRWGQTCYSFYWSLRLARVIRVLLNWICASTGQGLHLAWWRRSPIGRGDPEPTEDVAGAVAICWLIDR